MVQVLKWARLHVSTNSRDSPRPIFSYLLYFFSKGLVKSRRKNGQDSQSRDTDADEKIAATKLLNVQLKIKI